MVDKELAVQKILMLRELQIRKARESFYNFCKVISPSFFTDNRPHLKTMCDAFQGIYEGTLINKKTGKPYRNMALSVPPSHGKSYTASLFSMWCYGQRQENRIITVSYNEKMSSRFARTVRNGIQEESGDLKDIVFQDIFPTVKIKYGDASSHIWALEGQYQSYLATSFKASLTGMRGEIGIIDDPIKDHMEAFNDSVLDEKWEWYTDTFLSRIVEGGKQIVIATRWSTNDIIGCLIDIQPEEWYVVNLSAYDEETDTMLCPDILSYDSYKLKQSLMSPEIFQANYQQVPVNARGRLYQEFRTYKVSDLPLNGDGSFAFERIINYTDTADKGADWLCSIVAGQYKGQLYILDVLYTKDGMEVTEKATARMLFDNRVNLSKIESNNGGRGFARVVEGLLWENHNSRYTKITWFHQSKNKEARILTQSSFVQNNIFFPTDWVKRWKDFYKDLNSYQREGKNRHDDAPDAITGLAEMINNESKQWKAVPSLY